MNQKHLPLESLSQISVTLPEIAREHGRVTVKEATQSAGTSRNTIKDHLTKLACNGHLNRHGACRGV